jgi:hypothetical protein
LGKNGPVDARVACRILRRDFQFAVAGRRGVFYQRFLFGDVPQLTAGGREYGVGEHGEETLRHG